ncbi:hypothetical protein CEXT_475591 [Caerostris extrusa]|uniref:Uncharacterized protein n=1 Tax=Caerostris extrusa TaxID=172846 RepID=A0AAV4N6V0_CAEEX|nr:hypothetical protein CEXT_475591 [Caerostris extrusa]
MELNKSKRKTVIGCLGQSINNDGIRHKPLPDKIAWISLDSPDSRSSRNRISRENPANQRSIRIMTDSQPLRLLSAVKS